MSINNNIFFLSDHLCSASYLTNDAGQVMQTLNHLPYGEDWVDIQHYMGARYSNMELYTFTGKDPRMGWRTPLNYIIYSEQRYAETGYGYFGARYMDHELMTMWLSVDPLSVRYPSISPYVYCVWKPLKLVDPDGREIAITINNYVYTLKSFKQAEEGWTLIWVDKTGKEVSFGNDEFSKSVNQAISGLLDSQTGLDMVRYLLGSSNRCLITPSSDDGCHFNSESNEIQFADKPNHTKNTGGYSYDNINLVEANDENCPAYIGLAHEFAHCADFWLGKTESPNDVWVDGGGITRPIRNAERYAMTVENYIRSDKGLPERLWYFYGERNGYHYYYGDGSCVYQRKELFIPNRK